MIEIKPQKDFDNAGIVDKRKIGDNTFVFTARDGEDILGYGAISLCDGFARIEDIKTVQGFEMLLLSIGKALLNFAERRSFLDAYSDNEKIAPTLKLLGFKKADNEYYLNLKGYFDAKCSEK